MRPSRDHSRTPVRGDPFRWSKLPPEPYTLDGWWGRGSGQRPLPSLASGGRARRSVVCAGSHCPSQRQLLVTNNCQRSFIFMHKRNQLPDISCKELPVPEIQCGTSLTRGIKQIDHTYIMSQVQILSCLSPYFDMNAQLLTLKLNPRSVPSQQRF